VATAKPPTTYPNASICGPDDVMLLLHEFANEKVTTSRTSTIDGASAGPATKHGVVSLVPDASAPYVRSLHHLGKDVLVGRAPAGDHDTVYFAKRGSCRLSPRR